MKKIIAMLIALTLVFAFAACSSNTDNQAEEAETVDFSLPEATTPAPNLPIAVSCTFSDDVVHVTSDEETVNKIVDILRNFKTVDAPASYGEKEYTLTVSYTEADQTVENYGSFFRCGENWYTVSEGLNNNLSSLLRSF